MAQFDMQYPAMPDQERMHNLEQHVNNLTQEILFLRSQPSPSPHSLPTHPNLNLPPPSPFSGVPADLPVFKLKLQQFLMGNPHTYTDSASQLLYAGSLLTGQAGQWYISLIDPTTLRISPDYTLASFFQELQDFFGGGVTLDSRERSLDALRQTATVSDLAISFQNIANTFSPRWPDHPLIYCFSRKLKEAIRFELTARGSLPTTFLAYVAAAIAVEHNQAAAQHSRSQNHQQPSQSSRPLPPRLPPPLSRLPAPSDHAPMDLDGSRGPRGALTVTPEMVKLAEKHLLDQG